TEEGNLHLLALVLVRVVLHLGDSVYRRQFPVPSGVFDHGAVLHGRNRPSIPDVIEAPYEGVDHPHRAPVRDHQYSLSGMALEHILEEATHPLGERVVRLGVTCAVALAGTPARDGLGVPLLDLSVRQTLPRAEAALADAR